MNIELTVSQEESLRGLLGQVLDEMDLSGNIVEDILAIYDQLTPEREQ